MTDTLNTLRIDASARKVGSVSRLLGDTLIEELRERGPLDLQILDLSSPPPVIDSEWVAANGTPAPDRSTEQSDTLSLSDQLVDQLEQADLLVITTPIYNFGVPAALKAWIDQVARAGRTFRYTDQGPVGLLEHKCAVVLVTSGGTRVGSDIDFTTPYLKHVLGFIGIHDVSFIAADALGQSADQAIARAQSDLATLARSIH
jgi:FMN-dependent NADH-azoreductase